MMHDFCTILLLTSSQLSLQTVLHTVKDIRLQPSSYLLYYSKDTGENVLADQQLLGDSRSSNASGHANVSRLICLAQLEMTEVESSTLHVFVCSVAEFTTLQPLRCLCRDEDVAPLMWLNKNPPSVDDNAL